MQTQQLVVSGTRPRIDVNSTVPEMVAAALPALAAREVYQRGGDLVHVARDPERDPDGIIRTTGKPRIRELPRQLLSTQLSESAEWCSIVSTDRGKREDAVDVPAKVTAEILDAGEWDHIRPLRSIAHWPVYNANHEIVLVDGYDPVSRYLLSGVPSLSLPTAPTHADAAASLDALLDLIDEFPIDGPAGRSAWIAAMVTVIARAGVDGPVPCVFFDAPTPGSGKTLLARLVSLIVAGEEPAVRAAPSDGAEWSRAMLAIATGGEPITLLDNLRGKVESGVLEAVITSAKYSDRKLRSSEDVTCDVQTLFLLTANNASITTDLARRALHCRLIPIDERPELRGGYKLDLKPYVAERRSQLLTHLLTILRAYDHAGRPSINMRPMGSFEAWSAIVRAPLIWAGAADPAETQDGLRESAATGVDDQRVLLEAWHDHCGDRALSVRELLDELKRTLDADKEHATARLLTEALSELCGVKAPAVGAELKKLRGRVLGGLRLDSAGKSNKGQRWKVTGVK